MLRRNVLILHAAALGDFVLTWPLILALGRTHPQSRIIVVAAPGKGKLAEAALRVESADIERGWHKLFALNGQPTDRAAKLCASAHSVYSFVSAPGDLATQNLQRWTDGADVIPLQSKPPTSYTKHATQFLLDQLQAHRPAIAVAMEQMLRSIADRGLGLTPPKAGPILIHPGSGSLTKNWPLEHFIELAGSLPNARILLGEVEQEKWPQADRQKLGDVAEVTTPPDYPALFNEIRQARAYISNDSGPTHLAAIAGVSTIALFAATDPRVWSPLGPRVRVLQNPSVDEVLRTCETLA